VTITEGTNRLVGTKPSAIVEAAGTILDEEDAVRGRRPELWDGSASGRIADVIENWAG
jgi:UDP-N-acetylglucosamine 2-epimerase (non-hydrolysing)